MFYLLVVWLVVISTSAREWLERLVSEMTYTILIGTLKPTHPVTRSLSLTHCWMRTVIDIVYFLWLYDMMFEYFAEPLYNVCS